MSIFYVSDALRDIDLDDSFWSIKDSNLLFTELWQDAIEKFERFHKVGFINFQKVVVNGKLRDLKL